MGANRWNAVHAKSMHQQANPVRRYTEASSVETVL